LATATRAQTFFRTTGVSLEIEGLQKTYRTAVEEIRALHEIHWKVPAGKCIAIMGPSGCGKTTLMNIVGGVDRGSAGRVVVDGIDLAKSTERELEKYRLLKVGFIFQLFNLIPSISALENLELPMMMAGAKEQPRRERASALLDMVGLGAKGLKRPEELSGGEQRRVAVALALGNDPALILADEPTGNLDSGNAETITRLLRSLSQDYGKTVIMVTHDPRSAEAFPEVHSMRDGRFEERA
jgi:putative ABC transport system ATP-binding protein